jgi:excisionase family DNA binding protein
MLDEGNTKASGSEQLRTLYDDGRLTWTVTEAAKLLGISPTSAYEAARRGELPVRVIGRRMLVPRVALLRLLTEQP